MRRAHPRTFRHRRVPTSLRIAAAVVVLGAGGGAAAAVALTGSGSRVGPGRAVLHLQEPGSLRLVGSVPAPGASGVASDTAVSLVFSRPVRLTSALPTIDPPVAGTWSRPTPTTLAFTASAPFLPLAAETITVASGSTGLRGVAGSQLAVPATVHFTVAAGSTLRLQQLLAQLGYLPLSFTPSGPPPAAAGAAMAQDGTFAWRWPGLPDQLTSMWVPGDSGHMTEGAVMSFERTSHLAVDGVASQQVWGALLAASAAGAVDPSPYTYVLVSKSLPETLALYVDGNPQYQGILVNTGVHGADTPDGTYPVFEHVVASRMKGTNPDGTTYDDPNVPWASFFTGGDALHGFVRSTYGWPQSNGCVEMPIAVAQVLWPLTPVGTLVTVIGPSS